MTETINEEMISRFADLVERCEEMLSELRRQHLLLVTADARTDVVRLERLCRANGIDLNAL